ncbi:MAG: hypothetical protein Tsb0034_15840 [Ekhidna sp.]
MATMLSFGAVLMDTTYAGFAIGIQVFLAERVEFTNYFYLIAASVLLVLGVASLSTRPVPLDAEVKTRGNTGFIKGLILGLLNPLAMPFWLGVTTYLSVEGWIELSGSRFWAYLVGVGLGEFLMLMVIIRIGKRFELMATNRMIVQVVPGIALVLLGLFNFYSWLSFYL